MEAWHHDDRATIYHGDCLEVLRELPDASVDSVVTDPPYGLGFMGCDWDDARRLGSLPPSADKTPNLYPRTGKGPQAVAFDGMAFQLWCQEWVTEALRVLKPGGHLLAFGGTRTWHRLAVAVEDAGFEVRDSIAWLYGSGFPKSLDVSKAIDKARDDRPDILRVTSEIARLRDLAGLTNRDLDDAFGFAGMAGHWTSTKSQPTVPRVEQWAVLRDMLSPAPWLDDEVWRLNGRKGTPGEAWAMRPVLGERDVPVGHAFAGETYGGDSSNKVVDVTAPATPAAQQWQGWGTALKPAFEPVVVARKPLTGTVAANVLEHGVGGLNIDGCRIGTDEDTSGKPALVADTAAPFGRGSAMGGNGSALGRWPANVVLDEDQAEVLDGQSGVTSSVQSVRLRAGAVIGNGQTHGTFIASEDNIGGFNDSGGASRFFYCAKAPKKERPKVDGVAHPTVKPLALMRYLCRLVTPPGGVILEPFAGSGTTVEAALNEGFQIIAIEREGDYLPLIAARLERIAQEPDDGQLTLDASA